MYILIQIIATFIGSLLGCPIGLLIGHYLLNKNKNYWGD